MPHVAGEQPPNLCKTGAGETDKQLAEHDGKTRSGAVEGLGGVETGKMRFDREG
jgi:hypothetical protein